MFQFLHAADLHLDSPLTGLARYEGLPAEEVRNASRGALERLVECAIERRVRFVLLAGDIYDGSWKDASTGLFFARSMGRLRHAGVEVYLIHGNHDAESQMARHIRLPENVHVLSPRRAVSEKVPEAPVVVHGQSFATRATLENLALQYPARVDGLFNIGLLHTSLAGYEGHDTYAPCALDDLAAKGYDYWALGHVHAEQVVSKDPYVVYPGNLQGRSIREPGPKGAYVVTVDDGLRVAGLEFVELSSFQWLRVEVDVAGCGQMADLQRRVEQALRLPGETPRIARLTLRGATALFNTLHGRQEWMDDLRALALDVGAERLWLEKVELGVEPEGAQVDWSGPMAEIEEVLRRPSAALAEDADLKPLLQKLPDDVRDEVAGWLSPGGARYAELMKDVEALLMARLGGGQ